MIIFNTTYCVPETVFEKWNGWVRGFHIPRMLETGYFSEPRLCKVLAEAEDAGDSYSLQFQAENMDTLLSWNEKFGKESENNFSREFGTEVLYFSTILEVL